MKNRAEFYRDYAYPVLSKLDAEAVHDGTLALLEMLGRGPVGRNILHEFACIEGGRFIHPLLNTQVAGLTLENPLMLAAGFDKNGRAVKALYELGFASIEVGTVTVNPQDGNPKPRLFRLSGGSLINHLGFPNDGVTKVYGNLVDQADREFPLGVSIGLNQDIPKLNIAHDLEILTHILSEVADYLVINLSSPNTVNLRDLLSSPQLTEIIDAIIPQSLGKPILLKISPDLSAAQLDRLMRLVLDKKLAGVIATNTTTDYTLLPHDTVFEPVKGGLSGKVLRQRSTEVIRHLYKESGGKLEIIGSGGVDSLESVLEKITAGAKAVSLYSGLVFTGPTLPTSLNRELAEWLESHGTSVREIIGHQL